MSRILNRKCFNDSQNVFVLIVLIWPILWQKEVILITFPQPCSIKSWTWYVKDFTFCTDIPFIMPKKKDKFYIYILWITKSYNTLKSYKKHAHTKLIFSYWCLKENIPGCFVDLFICRLSYNMFLFNYKIFRFFQCFLLCFLFPVYFSNFFH